MNFVHALLKAEAADQETDDYGENHPEGHGSRLGKHVIKYTAHFIGCQSGKLAFYHFNHIGQHPAPYSGIKHHQQVIAGDGDIG